MKRYNLFILIILFGTYISCNTPHLDTMKKRTIRVSKKFEIMGKKTKHNFKEVMDSFPFDFDSDGDIDFLITSLRSPPTLPGTSLPLLLLENKGGGKFQKNSTSGLSRTRTVHARDVAIADFTGDGIIDLFIADHGTDMPPFPGGKSKLLQGKKSGKYIEIRANHLDKELFTFSVTAGDIDNDGDIDLYMNNIGPEVSPPFFYLNMGKGDFQASQKGLPIEIIQRKKKYLASLLIDIDRDGDLDLFLGGHDGMQADEYFARDALLLNDGKGNFRKLPEESLPKRVKDPSWGTVDVITADINQDQWPDLVMLTHNAGFTQGALQIMINNRDRTFRPLKHKLPPITVQKGHWLPWLSIADVNGDKLPDILFTIRHSGEKYFTIKTPVRLFINTPGEQFIDRSSELPVEHQWFIGAHFFDANGDGRVDIFLMGYNSYTVLLNSGRWK